MTRGAKRAARLYENNLMSSNNVSRSGGTFRAAGARGALAPVLASDGGHAVVDVLAVLSWVATAGGCPG